MSQIKLTADSGGGTTSLKAPSSTTSNADVVLKLPVADGSANQVLKTDGSGQLSFTSNAGTTINNQADNRLITCTGTTGTLNGESTLTYDGDTLLSTNTNFVIKSIDTNASNAENYIQFNAGYITYDSDASNSTGYSGHYFQVDGSEKLRINNSGQLVFDADTNTYLARPAADTLAVTTGGTERMRIDSSGKVGIGTGSPVSILHLHEAGASGSPVIQFSNGDTGTTTGDGFAIGVADNESPFIYNRENTPLRIATNNTERMRIDATGNVFFAEMVNLNASSSNKGINIENQANYGRMNIHANGSAGNALGISFYNDGTNVGTIYYNTSSTTYNTSSDYRLKENVTAISDGITRLKTLKPSRFNFKVDKDKTVDGFIAHEVTPVVPEAITGTKDEVDSDKKPVYQGIDQSKLVPLLTAALQEAVGKIETLETKVAALEGA